MKIEIHILQNLAPSNLNRDDTGAPKDCEFGGYRRARVSSQCWKRAVREAFKIHGAFKPEELAVRTKRVLDRLGDTVAAKRGVSPEEAQQVGRVLLQGAGLGLKEEKPGNFKTEYLLFLPSRTILALADLADRAWDELSALVQTDTLAAATAEGAAASADPTTMETAGDTKAKKGPGKKAVAKKATKTAELSREVKKEVESILEDGSRTPDLALFGRMIADKPGWNLDAACQVAHALSTNRVTMEFDFYTAIDDLRREDTAGSDMMGTVQFNSACFYRYAVLDVDDLRRNLASGANPGDADVELLRRTVEAFVRAFVQAIPSAKQNTMAAHNPPSYVLTVVRDAGAPVSLANAFVQPVRPRSDADLVTASIEALENHLGAVTRMHGVKGIRLAAMVDDRREGVGPLYAGPVTIERKTDMDGLVADTLHTALATPGAEVLA